MSARILRSCASRCRALAVVTLMAAGGCAHPPVARPATVLPTPGHEQLLAIAAAAERTGDRLRAQHYLVAARKLGADRSRTLPWLLRLYVADQQYRLAIDTASDHLRTQPDDAELRLVLAHLYEATGGELAAIAEYERVLSKRPNEPRAHFGLGALLHEHGRDPMRADLHFRAYLALAPTGSHAAEARSGLLEEVP